MRDEISARTACLVRIQPHHVQVTAVARAVAHRQDDPRHAVQQFVEPHHPLLPLLDDPVDLRQLGEPYRVLCLGHPVVEADTDHPHLRPPVHVPEGLQLAHLLGELLVVTRHRAPFAQTGHILVALEAVARSFSRATDRLTPVQGPHRVRRVVYHRNPRLLRDLREPVDVARQAAEVHRDDGPRLLRDLLPDLRRVQIHGGFVDIREDYFRAPGDRGAGRAHESQRRGDHLVPRADLQSHHAAVQGRAA